MTRIYLLRHGQTQFNLKNLIQGSCDSKLTDRGIMQAKGANEYLNKIKFAAVFCSTSERTLDTANYALDFKYSVTPCKEFKEIDFGDVEGEIGSNLFKGLDCQDYSYLLLNEGWQAINGESGFSLTKRVFKKLDQIVAAYPDENILIVTHGGTIMNIAMNIDSDLNYKNINGPDNCSITIVDHQGGYRLVDYNLDVSNTNKIL